MATFRIEWLYDSHSCETCGTSGAEGARVFKDGELILDMKPVAHCFDGVNYYESDVFTQILKHLGHEVSDDR